MTPLPPSPEQQLLFLRCIQRLLVEGQFTASYKFALLHALADLSVLKGDDSGGELELQIADIAQHFIELYWQQCRPFEPGHGSSGYVLLQNTGRQAAVISQIFEAQRSFGGSLARLRVSAPDLWTSLTGSVTRVVSGMPLWKLQTVGSERLDFLYENLDRSTRSITLKPGVAYCFRAFYGLVRDLIQGAWVRFVQRLNASELGHLTDLGAFLFDQQRASLEPYKAILTDLQGGRCFYCQRDLHRTVELDHFVPWARYPTDLGHNFVAAHPKCNRSKSDHLAAEQHLHAWVDRNRHCGQLLLDSFRAAGLPADSAASTRIIIRAYEQVERARGQVWLRDTMFLHLGHQWRRLLVPDLVT